MGHFYDCKRQNLLQMSPSFLETVRIYSLQFHDALKVRNAKFYIVKFVCNVAEGFIL